MKALPRTVTVEEFSAVRSALAHPVLWDLLQRRQQILRDTAADLMLDPASIPDRVPLDELRREAYALQYATDFLSAVFASAAADPSS